MQGPLLPAGENFSLPQRLIRVFFAPRTSFEAVCRHETWFDWFIPTLLASAVWIVANYITLPLATDPNSTLAQHQLQSLTAEQWQARAAMLLQHGWLTEPLVNTFFNLAAMGLALYVLVCHLFRRQITLRQALVVVAYAFMVQIIAAPVWTGLVLLDLHPDRLTSLAFLLPEEDTGTFVGKFSANLGLFDAWETCLIGLGLAVATHTAPRKAVAVTLTIWVLWIAGVTAVQDLVPSPAPEQQSPVHSQPN